MTGQVTNPDSQPRAILTVSQLNREVRGLLDGALPLLWIEGEISNLARPASGHLYFSLKDQRAQVRCALFRQRAGLLRFRPDNGQQVLLRARVSLYEPRGDYQLLVESMEPAGDGLLRRQFEELRARLEAEGLFQPTRKRALPSLPRRIAVITSPSGAAIRDVLQILRRRFPGIPVRVYPVPVQGPEAPPRLIRMIELADADPDNAVILVTRGGGSLEDLQAFNEESVARAVAACQLPVVSAVGHETDVTICDLVADVRAPTPSAAAELLSPDRMEWLRSLSAIQDRLRARQKRHLTALQDRLQTMHGRLRRQHPGRRLLEWAQRLDRLEIRLTRRMAWIRDQQRLRLDRLRQRLALQQPARGLRQRRQHVATLSGRLRRAQRTRLDALRQTLGGTARALENVSPLATVARGYAIVSTADGRVIRSVTMVRPDDQLTVRLSDGSLQVRVRSTAVDGNGGKPQ